MARVLDLLIELFETSHDPSSRPINFSTTSNDQSTRPISFHTTSSDSRAHHIPSAGDVAVRGPIEGMQPLGVGRSPYSPALSAWRFIAAVAAHFLSVYLSDLLFTTLYSIPLGLLPDVVRSPAVAGSPASLLVEEGGWLIGRYQ